MLSSKTVVVATSGLETPRLGIILRTNRFWLQTGNANAKRSRSVGTGLNFPEASAELLQIEGLLVESRPPES